jgi:hypothetical protein
MEQKKFNLLAFMEDMEPSYCKNGYKIRMSKFRCDCGKEVIKRYAAVKAGSYKSCGCLKRVCHEHTRASSTRHGLRNHRLYKVYKEMVSRCSNVSHKRYSDYGGRGISVCPRWVGEGGLQLFLQDMYPSYKEGLELDRIDNDSGYSPDNCKWRDSSDQNHNQRKRKGPRSSQYKGVSWHKHSKKFVACLSKNGELLLCKNFKTELEAAIAYDNISEEVYGNRPNKTERNPLWEQQSITSLL